MFTSSRSSVHFRSDPSRSSSAPTTSTSLVSSSFSIVLRQVVSTVLNLRPSAGICCMMSSEPKMGSR